MKKMICILLCLCLLLSCFSGCSRPVTTEGLGNGWEPTHSMQLQYANQFSVDYYDGGYKLVSIADGSRFLVIPENGKKPEGISADIVPLYQPLDRIYLAATSAMCLFDAMQRLDSIRLSGTREDGWYIENAVNAMQNGDILYAGKYSEPDYELILSNDCDLAIESTMIGHASDVKDKQAVVQKECHTQAQRNRKDDLGQNDNAACFDCLGCTFNINAGTQKQQKHTNQRTCTVYHTGKKATNLQCLRHKGIKNHANEHWYHNCITRKAFVFQFFHLLFLTYANCYLQSV